MKKENQLTYTTIIHSARNKLGLSNNEYIFCDTIYHLSNNPDYKYCIMSKDKLGEIIGVSKQAIHKLLIKMIKLGLIEKEETLKGLKTTEKWYNTVILKDESTKFTDSKESLPLQSTKFTPTVKKVYSDSKESLHNNNNNNNNNNTNNTIEEETCVSTPKQIAENFFMIYKLPEDQVLDEVKEIVFNLREKYGKSVDFEIKKFISYWTEPTPSGKKQRWEIEKTFEVKRRLITWLSRANKFSGQSNDRVIIGLDI